MLSRLGSRRLIGLALFALASAMFVGGWVLASRSPVSTGPSGTSTTSRELPGADARSVYGGLGSWVDIFDARAWRDPAGTVRDMARHGVRTLYIETGNSSRPTAIFKPDQLAEFIEEAHSHDIRVVAWYLPDLKNVPRDYSRVAAAIAFTTPRGERFDSFALDIESSALKPVSARNAALETLSLEIRALVGPEYPLGAIIPSPNGLQKKGSYWRGFPYAMLAKEYDIFLPMAYYTYHWHGASAVYDAEVANVSVLRAQPGCEKVPVHLIGGIANESSTAELAAFVRAARDEDCVGASLYDWTGTTPAMWRQLATLKPAAAQP